MAECVAWSVKINLIFITVKAMKHRIIFKTIVGSQAYGTNVEGSDIDIKGVYIQTPMELMTFGYVPLVEVNKDEVYYEIRRFIELLSTANPTVLEMLYSPADCIQVCEPEFEILLKYRDEFLTKKCEHSFGGYAVQQIKKARGLNKKMNWEKEAMTRKTPLDFCYFRANDGESKTLIEYLKQYGMKQEFCGLTDIPNFRYCYNLFYDAAGACSIMAPKGYKGIQIDNSNTIRLSETPKEATVLGVVTYNKDAYTQHCNAYKDYTTWLKERNTQRYVDIENHGQQIDGKNMLHCMRLILTAIDVAKDKTLTVRRDETECEYLKGIRHGKEDLTKLLDTAEAGITVMKEQFQKSDLPNEFKNERGNEILTEIREYVSDKVDWEGFREHLRQLVDNGI